VPTCQPSLFDLTLTLGIVLDALGCAESARSLARLRALF
jgi:hypothetical protein